MKKNIKILSIVILIYLTLYFISPIKTTEAITYSFGIIKEIIPILFFVFIITTLFNLIDEKKLKQKIQTTKNKNKYFLMSLLGVISHGPVYAWYPFLKNVKEKGMSNGSLSVFIYTRGIKIALIPIMIGYFGAKFTILFTILIFIFSFIQGVLIDKIVNE
jgi:uncharacterized membrane protein YraQ (UPF0718 family)